MTNTHKKLGPLQSNESPPFQKLGLFQIKVQLKLRRDLETASHCLNQSSQYPYIFVNDVLGFSAGPDVDVDFYLLDRRL